MPATRLLLLAGRNVSDPVGEGSVLRPLVEAAQLDHVVDQADHGGQAAKLFLQLKRVLPQLPALLPSVSHVVQLSSACVCCFGDGGCLSSQLDQDQHQLFMALPEKVPSSYVRKVATKLLKRNIIHNLQTKKTSFPKYFVFTLFNVSRSDPRAPELGFRLRDRTNSSAGSGENNII